MFDQTSSFHSFKVLVPKFEPEKSFTFNIFKKCIPKNCYYSSYKIYAVWEIKKTLYEYK